MLGLLGLLTVAATELPYPLSSISPDSPPRAASPRADRKRRATPRSNAGSSKSRSPPTTAPARAPTSAPATAAAAAAAAPTTAKAVRSPCAFRTMSAQRWLSSTAQSTGWSRPSSKRAAMRPGQRFTWSVCHSDGRSDAPLPFRQESPARVPYCVVVSWVRALASDLLQERDRAGGLRGTIWRSAETNAPLDCDGRSCFAGGNRGNRGNPRGPFQHNHLYGWVPL